MPRRPPLLISVLIVAIVVGVGSYYERSMKPAPPAPTRTGEAFSGNPRVVDGDSLELAGHRVRLFGIDAPESVQDCRDADGRSYACGRDARNALSDEISGANVSCTPVGTSYDRDVSICIANGRDLSEAMVRSGHALELRQHSRGRYTAAEREAQSARRGLWAGDFQRPSQWRQQHPR